MNIVKPHQCSALDPPWFSIRVLSVEVGGNPTRGKETFDGEDWSYLDGGGGVPEWKNLAPHGVIGFSLIAQWN